MRGFPGGLEVHTPASCGKAVLVLTRKTKAKHLCPSPPLRRRGRLLLEPYTFQAVLPPDLIFPITPSAHKSPHPLQRTRRVFGDRLCWVTEQKMLNYLHKWPARSTLFPFGPRMYYMTSFCSAYPAPPVWFTLISKRLFISCSSTSGVGGDRWRVEPGEKEGGRRREQEGMSSRTPQ